MKYMDGYSLTSRRRRRVPGTNGSKFSHTRDFECTWPVLVRISGRVFWSHTQRPDRFEDVYPLQDAWRPPPNWFLFLVEK